jgi:hypothetical protein
MFRSGTGDAITIQVSPRDIHRSMVADVPKKPPVTPTQTAVCHRGEQGEPVALDAIRHRRAPQCGNLPAVE